MPRNLIYNGDMVGRTLEPGKGANLATAPHFGKGAALERLGRHPRMW